MNSTSPQDVKKNKKKNSKDSTASRAGSILAEKFKQSPVAAVVTLSFILGLVVSAVAGFIAWQTFVVQERTRQLDALAEEHARIAAANVVNYLYSVDRKLVFYTKSSALANAFIYKDPVGLLEHKNALKSAFPQASSIRLFPAGEAKLDMEAKPPIRFAELELIRRAERREQVIPEALDSGGSGWRINIVEPVPADPLKPVVGTIMITLPIEEMYNHLREGIDQVGKVTLYQSFDGQQRMMGSFGRGDLHKAERISVQETPWHVEFVASRKLRERTEIDYVVLALVGVVAALGIIAAFLFVGLAIGRNMRRKQEALEETRRRMGRKMEPQEEGDAAAADVLNVQIQEEDESLLGAAEEDEEALDISEAFSGGGDDDVLDIAGHVPDHIFRSYDIRGIYETEITHDLARGIGQALGSEALENGERALIVGRDARTHSPILTENLIRGILSTGCNVINIGTVPTPVLYYAVEVLEQTASAVMVTASHNPGEFNGFKVVMGGQTRCEEDIKSIRARILGQKFKQGIGKESQEDIVERYVETIFSDVALAGDISVVIDAGSGVTGKVAPHLFTELGCHVTPLYCDLDGTFPHHGPDPSNIDNLQDLIAKVKETGADLGVAFDGDGDRLAVVTPKGEVIWPDQLLMLFAKDILARNPGADVVFDVKSSRLLNNIISSNGGRPIMWKTGHALMRAKVMETGALLGGEFSGHIFIKDRWYGFDDGMYAAARLIEIISLRDEPLDDIFDELPKLQATPEIRVEVSEEAKFGVIERLAAEGDFGDAKVTTIDGVRLEFPDGWALVRASNTSAHLTLRFEAETEEQIHTMKALITREVRKIDPSIEFNWSGQ